MLLVTQAPESLPAAGLQLRRPASACEVYVYYLADCRGAGAVAYKVT